MRQSEFERYREILSTFPKQQLINWLCDPANSVKIDLYRDFLPNGLEYISPPLAINCFDYATYCKGHFQIETETLIRGEFKPGNLILYFFSNYKLFTHRPNDDYIHAGRIVGNDRVISQWGIGGAVFEHGVFQVPSLTGNAYHCFEMPKF